MKNTERRDAQMPYISDEEVMEQQKKTRRILQQLNTVDISDFDRISELVKELLENPRELSSIRRSTATMDSILKQGKIFMPIITAPSWM